MKNGTIIENQSTNKIFSNPQHAYTRELVNFKSSNFRDTLSIKNNKVLETSNLSW